MSAQAAIVRPEFHLPGGDHFVKIPDGKYVAHVCGHEAFFYRGNPACPRVTIWFYVVDDVGSERRIAGYYRVRELLQDGRILQPKDLKITRLRSFQFTAGWRSDIVNDLARLFPDRFSPAALPTSVPPIDGTVRICTATVASGHDGTIRSEKFQASKVQQILGWDFTTDLSMDSSIDVDLDLDPYRFPKGAR